MTQTTRRTALRTTLGLAALALFALPGCGGGDGNVTPDIDPTVGSIRRVGDLELNLVADKRAYRMGEPIQFAYTIKNVGTSSVTLSYPGTIFIPAISQNGTQIPISPQGGGATITPVTVTLAPGQVSTDYYQWSTLYPAGTPIPAGTYSVYGYPGFVTLGGQTFTAEQAKAQLYSNPVSFTVLP